MLIRLKKYLNPHENSCSKVISILITGNSLHESSSAPQQYKSVQYKWFALYLHRDVSHTDMLQPHFISCRGVSGGRRQHARIQEFLSVLFSPQLILKFKEGFHCFIAEKTILILYKGSRGRPLFSGGGGGVSNFFPGGGGGGVQMLIFIETHICTCYFPGGVSGPPIPLWIHTWAMYVIITGQYLSQSRL